MTEIYHQILEAERLGRIPTWLRRIWREKRHLDPVVDAGYALEKQNNGSFWGLVGCLMGIALISMIANVFILITGLVATGNHDVTNRTITPVLIWTITCWTVFGWIAYFVRWISVRLRGKLSVSTAQFWQAYRVLEERSIHNLGDLGLQEVFDEGERALISIARHILSLQKQGKEEEARSARLVGFVVLYNALDLFDLVRKGKNYNYYSEQAERALDQTGPDKF